MNQTFLTIPSQVAFDDDLPPNAKLLYGVIHGLCANENECFATNSYFSTLFKTSIRSITSWIKMLEQKNYISTELCYKPYTKIVQKRIIHSKIDINLGTSSAKFFSTSTEKNIHPSDKKYTEGGEENFHNNNKNSNIKTINNIIIPEEKDIENFIFDNNLNVNSEKFYKYYSNTNFLYNNKPINWKNKLVEWNNRNIKKEVIKPKPVQPDTPLADWEIELLAQLEDNKNSRP